MKWEGPTKTAEEQIVNDCQLFGTDGADWNELHEDWLAAFSMVSAEVKLKTWHWNKLPWLLCGIAQPDQELHDTWGTPSIPLGGGSFRTLFPCKAHSWPGGPSH